MKIAAAHVDCDEKRWLTHCRHDKGKIHALKKIRDVVMQTTLPGYLRRILASILWSRQIGAVSALTGKVLCCWRTIYQGGRWQILSKEWA